MPWRRENAGTSFIAAFRHCWRLLAFGLLVFLPMAMGLPIVVGTGDEPAFRTRAEGQFGGLTVGLGPAVAGAGHSAASFIIDHAANRARSSGLVSANFRPGGIQNGAIGLRPFIHTIQQ